MATESSVLSPLNWYGTTTPTCDIRSARRNATAALADAARPRSGARGAGRPVLAGALRRAGQLRPIAAPAAVYRCGRAGARADRPAVRAVGARAGLAVARGCRRFAGCDRPARAPVCAGWAHPQSATGGQRAG